jgi:hypothetical protein
MKLSLGKNITFLGLEGAYSTTLESLFGINDICVTHESKRQNNQIQLFLVE